VTDLYRSRLHIVDQMMFEDLAPRRGSLYPYMDHTLIERNLRQLDEIFPAIAMGFLRGAAAVGRVGAAAGRGLATAGKKGIEVGKKGIEVTKKGIEVTKKGVEKGIELGKKGAELGRKGFDKAKEGYKKAKEFKKQVDQARQEDPQSTGDQDKPDEGGLKGFSKRMADKLSGAPSAAADKQLATKPGSQIGIGDTGKARTTEPPSDGALGGAALGGAALGGAAAGAAAAKTLDGPEEPPSAPTDRKAVGDGKPQDTPTSSPTPPPHAEAPADEPGDDDDESPGIGTAAAGVAAGAAGTAAAGAAEPATEPAAPAPAPAEPPTSPQAAASEPASPEKRSGGGSGTGPRGATLAPLGGSCPSGRTKTSRDGAPEDSKRCNDQTQGRWHRKKGA